MQQQPDIATTNLTGMVSGNSAYGIGNVFVHGFLLLRPHDAAVVAGDPRCAPGAPTRLLFVACAAPGVDMPAIAPVRKSRLLPCHPPEARGPRRPRRRGRICASALRPATMCSTICAAATPWLTTESIATGTSTAWSPPLERLDPEIQGLFPLTEGSCTKGQ